MIRSSPILFFHKIKERLEKMKYQRVHNCCSKRPVKRGLWSPDEDLKLIRYIHFHGAACWPTLPDRAGLQRCGKSCRLRWMNYLRPGIKRGKFSEEEDNTIICLHSIMDNRWAQIARHLPGRTDSEIKNYWHSCLKKKKKKAPQTSGSTHIAAAMVSNSPYSSSAPAYYSGNYSNNYNNLNDTVGLNDEVESTVMQEENSTDYDYNRNSVTEMAYCTVSDQMLQLYSSAYHDSVMFSSITSEEDLACLLNTGDYSENIFRSD